MGKPQKKSVLIKYWLDTAEQDYRTMLHLYESQDYHWCLFIGHLVIEKLLKALYVKNVNAYVPKSHDLLRLADKALINTNEKQKNILDKITTFNISARYPDYKVRFYKKCDYRFTTFHITKIKELRKWLMSFLKKK